MRRIVLVDQIETPNFAGLFGCGLGKDIYTTQSLDRLPDKGKSILGNLGPGDAVMTVGSEPWKLLRQHYHFGIRNENFTDCTKLYRLSIEGGAFLKCVIGIPTADDIRQFLSPTFTSPRDFTGFKYKVLHTIEEANKFLDYLESLPLNTHFGFDYEASGMPLDKVFWVSGASICTEKFGGFISFTDIRHQTSDGKDDPRLMKRLGQFLLDRMDHVWVYNQQYEWLVSHRVLGVDLYNLCDASAVNVMDGYHLKKYSLKWTAQRVLGVTVWDSDFDRIEELIDEALYETVGKLKKDKKKVFKVTQNDFYNTPEWQILASKYPNYIKEFNALLIEYWGYPFMCIPSDILGKYCCLDSLHTLMIALSRKDTYSEDCWNVNLDNLRLGARLMGGGLYIDEPFRDKYEHYALEQMVWGITYCATARTFVKMNKHQAKAANIKRYNQVAIKLLEKGKFFQGDIVEITKNILLDHLDFMDAYDTGVNEGALVFDFGMTFATEFMEKVRESMTEIKFKGKIDDSIKRKKKLLGVLAEKIKPLIGLDTLKIDPTNNPQRFKKHIELEKYLYYKKVYEELVSVSNSQLLNIKQIPAKIRAFGQNFTQEEYADYVSDNFFKCKSPIENDKIAEEFTSLYPSQTCYLAAMLESTQQLSNTDHFYEARGISDIDQGFHDFMTQWEAYCKGTSTTLDYPDKVFNLAIDFWNAINVKSAEFPDKLKDTWTNFDGFKSQSQFFPAHKSQFLEYEKPFSEADFGNDFFFMRKMVLNYLLYKKYAKLKSTYVGSDGMFKKNNLWVIEGEDHIPIREADPEEPGAREKCFVKYEVMQKSSKRWSSAFHTIISHGDCKDCLCPPPSFDENGNIIYGGSDQILTYFDISSAEVKAAGFASGDPDLIAKFEAGEDIYIYSAKLYLGEDGWNRLDKGQKKKWRKRFKTVFLGVLYGLGKNSLAERLDASLSDADHIIQSLYTAFPKLREYVDRQGEFPLEHDGYINTFLGDKLRLIEYADYLPKAATQREQKNIIARIKRLGVNLPIQGGTSSIMACGFFNNIRTSIEQAKTDPNSPFKDHALQPIIVVHDSNTNYIPVEAIFDIRKFYDVHYTGFCHEMGPKIYLLFDLLSGYSYETAKTMKQIDDDTIEYEGDAYSLLKLYDKIMGCKKLRVECSMTREELAGNIQLVDSPIDRFIREEGCNMTKDLSRVVIRFHRLGRE